MGQPSRGNARLSASEFNRVRRPTRGTDTSQYPQEKKETLDSLSSGERKGMSLNRARVKPCALRARGCGGVRAGEQEPAKELQRSLLAEAFWKVASQKVKGL